MVKPAEFSVVERLRDGRPVEIRALKRADRDGLRAAVGRASERSRFLRFFGAKRDFSEREVEFFTDVDFISHVALVAVAMEGGRPVIVGGGRYVVTEPGKAEVAFFVIDAYQAQGIGSSMLRHLIAIARDAKLEELVAEVLPENASMLQVLKKSGPTIVMKRDPQVVHVTLKIV